MNNHYHIVIETAEGNLSMGMRQLNGVYTQRSNKRYGRVGHVFQGRYQATLVDRHAYLLELSRYVVLNPVRAHIVLEARDWQWSSYRAMVATERPDEWLEVDWILSLFGKQRSTAIRKYIDFVRAGVDLPSIWERVKHSGYLGDESFVEHVGQQMDLSKLENLNEVSRLQRRPLALSLERYAAKYPDPKWAMAKAFASGNYSMKQISQWFGVHYCTVSRAVKSFESSKNA